MNYSPLPLVTAILVSAVLSGWGRWIFHYGEKKCLLTSCFWMNRKSPWCVILVVLFSEWYFPFQWYWRCIFNRRPNWTAGRSVKWLSRLGLTRVLPQNIRPVDVFNGGDGISSSCQLFLWLLMYLFIFLILSNRLFELAKKEKKSPYSRTSWKNNQKCMYVMV